MTLDVRTITIALAPISFALAVEGLFAGLAEEFCVLRDLAADDVAERDGDVFARVTGPDGGAAHQTKGSCYAMSGDAAASALARGQVESAAWDNEGWPPFWWPAWRH